MEVKKEEETVSTFREIFDWIAYSAKFSLSFCIRVANVFFIAWGMPLRRRFWVCATISLAWLERYPYVGVLGHFSF